MPLTKLNEFFIRKTWTAGEEVDTQIDLAPGLYYIYFYSSANAIRFRFYDAQNNLVSEILNNGYNSNRMIMSPPTTVRLKVASLSNLTVASVPVAIIVYDASNVTPQPQLVHDYFAQNAPSTLNVSTTGLHYLWATSNTYIKIYDANNNEVGHGFQFISGLFEGPFTVIGTTQHFRLQVFTLG